MKKIMLLVGILFTLMFNIISAGNSAGATASVRVKIDWVRVFDGQLVIRYTFTNIGDEWCWTDAAINNLKVFSTDEGYDKLIYEGSLTGPGGKFGPGHTLSNSAVIWDSKYRRISNDCIKWSVESVSSDRLSPAPAPNIAVANNQSVALPQNQTGYQRAFRVDSFNLEGDKEAIYIDFGNIQDATITVKGAAYTRYIVPVLRHNLTTGKKSYYKYVFIHWDGWTDKTYWGSFWIEKDMKWFNADWSKISYDEQIAGEGVDIYCAQPVSVKYETEADFNSVPWEKIDYEKHDDYAVLLETLMYKKGYRIQLDRHIP